jgi:hypothetical protein
MNKLLMLGWNDDRGFLHFDEAGGGSFFELGKDCFDLLARLDELDLDGKVIGDFENVGRVHAMRGAESSDSFGHCRAGNSGVEEEIEDRGVDGNAVVFRSITEEERDFYRFAGG